MSRTSARQRYVELVARPDVGRRVLQCRCGASLLWRGVATLVAAWRAGWVHTAEGWQCADCTRGGGT